LLQSFLLAQKEWQPILTAPIMEQFRQRIVASCHLAPLTDVECQAYIEYRMQQAGWDGEALILAGTYGRIFQFTHGVPRKINTSMDRVLLFGGVMKTIIKGKKHATWPRFDGLTYKERRKSYFKGKYNKRTFVTLILISLVVAYCIY
tara:strand:- start:37 stop:477 length:441 start_codon:yes stop_codon:yes gene_type:complete